MNADVCTDLLEGWKAIAQFIGLPGISDRVGDRLRRWERQEGLPVTRIAGRVFADRQKLTAWVSMRRRAA